jgi:hypothetical protein
VTESQIADAKSLYSTSGVEVSILSNLSDLHQLNPRLPTNPVLFDDGPAIEASVYMRESVALFLYKLRY